MLTESITELIKHIESNVWISRPCFNEISRKLRLILEGSSRLACLTCVVFVIARKKRRVFRNTPPATSI